MFVNYKTQGFVLKKLDRGEADQVFTIFTKDFGVLKILGRGIRKITSKLRGEIPVFSLTEIEFIQGKAYKTLTSAALIKDFQNIKKDLNRLEIAYQIAESFNQLVKPPEKDQKIYQFLSEVFNYLNKPQLPVADYQLLYFYFLWNLFSILGYKPELYKCLICKNKLKPGVLYFSSKGGMICNACFNKKLPECLEADVNTIKILREILKKDFPSLLKIKIGKKREESLKKVSDFYIRFILP